MNAQADFAQFDIGERLFGRFDPQTGRQTVKGLLDLLRDGGLAVGTRERVAVGALLAVLLAQRPDITALADLRADLAPLLARSPREREDFFRIFDSLAPVAAGPAGDGIEAPETLPATQPQREGALSWLLARPLYRLIPVVVILTAIAAAPLFYDPYKPVPEDSNFGVVTVPAAPAPKSVDKVASGEDAAPAAPVSHAGDSDVTRIIAAARDHDGAPTLDELARSLARTSPMGWSANAYAERLQELTGLPRHWPLALHDIDAQKPPAPPTASSTPHAADQVPTPPKPQSANSGEVRPLERILPAIRAQYPGTFYDAEGPFRAHDGNMHYRIKWLTPQGQVIWLDADATIGRVFQTQATKTWISSTGDDLNPCSRTAPCKTFPGATSKSATGGEIDTLDRVPPGGEIDTLDPGGFGTVTIKGLDAPDHTHVLGRLAHALAQIETPGREAPYASHLTSANQLARNNDDDPAGRIALELKLNLNLDEP